MPTRFVLYETIGTSAVYRGGLPLLGKSLFSSLRLGHVGFVKLEVQDHRRDIVGMTYVYPVRSRRSGGVSVGINLNPNSACNWRCIYCQVPNLSRGNAPVLELDTLREELEAVLARVMEGEFQEEERPFGGLTDIALSGNGEPTSSKQFPEVIDCIEEVMQEKGLLGKIKVIVISNGSFINKQWVEEGLTRLAAIGGEIWFKLDRATEEGRTRINGASGTNESLRSRLRKASALCSLRIQSCMFAFEGKEPGEEEIEAYLDFLAGEQEAGTGIRDVMLYGVARPSMQAEATSISRLPASWLESLGRRIEGLGFKVSVHP